MKFGAGIGYFGGDVVSVKPLVLNYWSGDTECQVTIEGAEKIEPPPEIGAFIKVECNLETKPEQGGIRAVLDQVI